MLRRLPLAALAVTAAAGLVQAQPAQPPPAAAPAEQAPPITVAAPPPVAVPPMSEKEVAPAPPPKATVEEKTVETPVRRARFDVAVIEALDKVTAENVRFEAAVGQPVRYKSLIFTVKACERSAPNEPIDDSVAYLTIDSQPRALPGKSTPPARQVFKGWMYASSPGLHPLEHPVYDAWLITCRAQAPAPGAAAPPASARPLPKPAASAIPAAAGAPVAKPPAPAPATPAKPPAATAPKPTPAKPGAAPSEEAPPV